MIFLEKRVLHVHLALSDEVDKLQHFKELEVNEGHSLASSEALSSHVLVNILKLREGVLSNQSAIASAVTMTSAELLNVSQHEVKLIKDCLLFRSLT